MQFARDLMVPVWLLSTLLVSACEVKHVNAKCQVRWAERPWAALTF